MAALGELGEQAVEHAGIIAERLEDEYEAVREAAVQTLGNMEDHAVPHAVARLEHDEAICPGRSCAGAGSVERRARRGALRSHRCAASRRRR